VIARFAAFAATVAALVAPATASAQVTRAIQSVSSPSSDHRWAPNAVPAQVGDTIQWRMTEPGNEANFVTHNVWVIKPGDAYPGVRLGSSIEGDGTASQLVDHPGTYAFYCSIHSTNGVGMNGTITVGDDDPGPPVDPGAPWTQPDTGGSVPTGPAQFSNPTFAPTIFEVGDSTRPTMSVAKFSHTRKLARVSVKVSEPGRLHLRLLRGSKIVKARTVKTKAGTNSATIALPKGHGRYRLDIWAQDLSGLESKWRYQSLKL